MCSSAGSWCGESFICWRLRVRSRSRVGGEEFKLKTKQKAEKTMDKYSESKSFLSLSRNCSRHRGPNAGSGPTEDKWSSRCKYDFKFAVWLQGGDVLSPASGSLGLSVHRISTRVFVSVAAGWRTKWIPLHQSELFRLDDSEIPPLHQSEDFD